MIEDAKSGFLLSNACKVDEIYKALLKIDFFKKEETRKKSYDIFLEKYNATKNYKDFLDEVLEKK
jgi:hypothetical protein